MSVDPSESMPVPTPKRTRTHGMGSALHPKRVRIAAETRDMITMRIAGKTFPQIAAAFGTKSSTVHARIERTMARYAAPEVAELRKMQDQRLDALLTFAWGRASEGSPDHLNICLRIEELRMRLWGTTARDLVDTEAGRPYLSPDLFRVMAEAAERSQGKLSAARALPIPNPDQGEAIEGQFSNIEEPDHASNNET